MTNTNEYLIEKAVSQALSESDDRNHEDLCHCGSWPASCVTYGDRKPWTHDAESVARAALAAFEKATTPPFPREVWGIQRGTWPPEKYQSEEIARWHLDQLSQGSDEYHLVKGTAYSIDWEVVK